VLPHVGLDIKCMEKPVLYQNLEPIVLEAIIHGGNSHLAISTTEASLLPLVAASRLAFEHACAVIAFLKLE